MLYSRRRLLQMGGTAAAVAFASRCASRVATAPAVPARRLEPVDVSYDRIIRRVVGLRPFRPSGFVVRAESLGDKLLVHNYGHGGAGVTLSWGTAELAADLVRESGRTGSAAVLGCGAVGLATARVLQDRGFDVTIYARDLPPDTTSNVAGAMWQPSFVVDRGHRTPEWDAQFERAQKVAHRAFQGLVGDDYAVRWREVFSLSEDSDSNGLPDWGLPELYPDRHALSASENPFSSLYVVSERTMFIEPPTYLRALLRDFHLAGGRIVVRDLGVRGGRRGATAACRRELHRPRRPRPLRRSRADPDQGPAHGAAAATEVDYAVVTRDLYMFPRVDGILLGGTHERGVETLEPDLEAEQRILAGQRAILRG